MELNDKNGDWIDEAPKLAALRGGNPFTVPERYFSELEEHLMLRSGLEPLTVNHGGFDTPEGYFESLKENIISLSTIEAEVERSGGNGFSVPEEYFSSLHHTIISQVTSSGKTRTTRLRRLFSSYASYAAAACIALVTATVIFFNTGNNKLESKFSEIPEDEIVNYLQIHTDAGDTPVIMDNLEKSTAAYKSSDLSEQEIKQYLESTL